jgi:hypothetical protein
MHRRRELHPRILRFGLPSTPRVYDVAHDSSGALSTISKLGELVVALEGVGKRKGSPLAHWGELAVVGHVS